MTTLETVQPQNSQAKKGIYEPYEEYHQCWYPVALSADIEKGTVKSVEFCDSRIAIYRGEDGGIRVVSARCKHMGADLGLGKVVGNHVQCPYHHWEYGKGGACVNIPTGDKIPPDTTLFSFPCEDKWGLIWVFLGEEPTHDVPSVPHWDEKTMLSRAFLVPLKEPLKVEPWVFGTNVFDFAHFKVVHHFSLDNCEKFFDDHHMGWESHLDGMGEVRLEMIGVSTVVGTSKTKPGEPAKSHIAGTTPMGKDGLQMFVTVFTDLEEDSEKGRREAEERLDHLQKFHSTLPQEDMPILNSIEFGKVRLTESDKELATYLGYVNRYPRTTVRKLDGRA